jgi:endonuclease/exonuclease/phosphatase family metal-dependent hydrolase
VWFDDYHDSVRMSRVVSEVRRLQPDLLCLQEVNAKLLSMLDPQLRQLGYSTQSVLRYSYGEMLWWRSSSVSSVQLTQEPFHDSQQGRHMHVVRCVVRGTPLAAATVHLESEAQNSSVRLAQLERVLLRLQGMGTPFLLAGDTNLGKKDDAKLIGVKAITSSVNDGEVMNE